MGDKIGAKYKNTYKDEYDTLYQAVFGEPNQDVEEFVLIPYEESFGTICGKNVNLRTNQDNSNSEDWEESSWSNLPDLLLENIFSYLTMQERYYSSLTCRSWYQSFYLPNSWRTFVFDDKTLTRSRFNYYSGWQVKLSSTLTNTACCLHNYRLKKENLADV